MQAAQHALDRAAMVLSCTNATGLTMAASNLDWLKLSKKKRARRRTPGVRTGQRRQWPEVWISSKYFFCEDAQQILAVAVLGKWLCELLQPGGADPLLAVGDFFRAGDLEALAVLQGGDEMAGLEQAVEGAGVQPGITALHDLHVELVALQVGLVDRGDFQFAAGAFCFSSPCNLFQ